MARGLPPAFVITQASAHSNPTLGNEFKVVNWLRAAAIIASVDPVKAGFVTTDAAGNFRLPPLRQLGSVDLLAAGQTNLLAEYTIHNLSDADFTFSIPAVADVQGAARKPGAPVRLRSGRHDSLTTPGFATSCSATSARSGC